MAVLAFPDSLRVGLDRLGHWRRLGLLFALGMVSATALPPLGLVPALLPGLVALAWTLEDAPGARQAFGRAWVFGFGHHVVGLAWISEAFLTDPVRLGWMIPIAISGLAALMALYIGLTGLAVRLLRFQGAALPFALAGFWTLFDWVRSWAFTGFPWNPIGSVWTASDALLQSGAW
ncbi:MAG: apolipoprotein N-acyltransferase, partial [Rhodospirillales bacterium]